MRTVILTDDSGADLGTADLLKAHTGRGMLHRAFSVYVFRNGGKDLLIQQRSIHKMLWPTFWANTCCSHPLQREAAVSAGSRRLREEMGFTVPLQEVTTYVYRAEDPSGKGVEHEHVTILRGDADETVIVHPDPREVMDWQWVEVQALLVDFTKNPRTYAPWFPLGLRALLSAPRV